MTTMPSDSPKPSNRPSYSCIRCSDRKVKCDRQNPCSTCVKHSEQCIFRPLPTPRKRQKRDKGGLPKDGLKQPYQCPLQESGVHQPNGSKQEEAIPTIEENAQLPTPASVISESERPLRTTQLVYDQGRSKFVDNSLWKRVVEEFHDPEEALEESVQHQGDAAASEDDFDFVLGVVPNPEMRSPHPSTEHIHQLWQMFKENIDPLIKVVHVPTLQPAIKKAAADTSDIPKSFEALLFAIYGIAVLSLTHDECKRDFGDTRKNLLSRYISATKRALSRANFMGTTSIVVLQALVLHLLCVRDIYEPRTLWSLTGIAMRIAESMGLHRDGATLGLPPFEAEIRRRIWWQLKMHDVRTAELSGFAKFKFADRETDPPKIPANVNDDELYPGMLSPPTESSKLTDMVFCLLRSSFGNFVYSHAAKFRELERRSLVWDEHGKIEDIKAKEEVITEAEEMVEMKYLRYCDPSQPLQLMAMLFGRSALNVGRFVVHHPRIWTSTEEIPDSEREYIWDISTKLLEQFNMLQSNPQLRHFAWHGAYYLQWHAIIYILDALRANPLMPNAVKLWQLVESLYENNPDLVTNTRKPIHVAVGNLCLKAFRARENAMMEQQGGISSPPEFISKLHQQREAAKARRQAREAKTKPTETIRNYNQAPSNETRENPDSTTTFPTVLENQQNMSSELPIFEQTTNFVESNSFWPDIGLNDGFLDTSNDIMNFDPDFMLAQDQSLGNTPGGQTISWKQWDAWLGDWNVMGVNSNDNFEDRPSQ